MKYIVVIPARYNSSRFQGKPLIDILGQTMLERVYRQCIQAVDPEFVYIATDNEEIQREALRIGSRCIMTSQNCLTGTDRVAEVANMVDADYYINVQGDEPLIDPNDIKSIVSELKECKYDVINGYTEIKMEEDYLNYSIPKVIFDQKGNLLYMSRAAIPASKSKKYSKAFRQVCVYSFSKSALLEFSTLSAKTEFEEIEDIEILRFLELGFKVKMLEMSDASISVDYPSDLDKVILKLHSCEPK
jgi:3-deoxy-manno-octulosonate cytidylyltransferase (CMP-KDO synthetase)